MNFEQNTGQDDFDFEDAVLDVLSEFCHCRPGIIETFDPETNTVSVSVAIQAKIIDADKTRYENYPLIENVPLSILYVQNQGLCVTLPIKPGDLCTLLFSDRMLDVFLRTGTVSPPEDGVGPDSIVTEPRMHHLADAICVPGLITRRFKNRPGAIPDWNTENIEIRDRERKVFISLGANGIEGTDGIARTRITEGMVEATDSEATVTIRGGEVTAEAPNGATITDTRAKWEMKDGRLSLNAPGGIDIDAPNFRIKSSDGYGWTSGIFRARDLETDAGFDANSHVHTGVEPGGGNTGTFA